MRRMYSVKELSEIIYAVVGGYIEDGAFDEIVADAVDAYLVEHPVDITALDGQTIAPAVVNATTSISAPVINGESHPSVKPIYFHPLTIYGTSLTIGEKAYKLLGTAIILNNSDSSLGSLSVIQTYMIGKFTRLNFSGRIVNLTDSKEINVCQLIITADHCYVVGLEADGTWHDDSQNQLDLISVISNIGALDGVNKIN